MYRNCQPQDLVQNSSQQCSCGSSFERKDKFLYIRKHYAYGEQYNYFNDANLVGWTRLGDKEHQSAIAVVLSNGWGGNKWMEVGKPNTTFYDITEHISETVTTNEYGWGEFSCKGGSVSVWLSK